MAEVQTIRAESGALQRVLDAIDDLGLSGNVIALEVHGLTLWANFAGSTFMVARV